MNEKRHQSSLVFPLLLVFIGLMFLLINMGVVDRSIWSSIIRFWPALLILMGIDTLLRRSSAGAALGALVSTAVLIVAGIALFHMFAPESWVARTQPFSHAIRGESAAEIILACQDCSMDIRAAQTSDALISGHVTLRRDEKLSEFVRYLDNTVQFQLKSKYWLTFPLSAQRNTRVWQAVINPSIPLSLSLEAAGTVNIDLRDLSVSSVDVTAGEESCRITLGTEDTTLFLSGDRIEIIVPQGVALRVTGSASMNLAVPQDYIQTTDGYQSPNYAPGVIHSEVVLRSGANWVEIRSL